MSPALGFDLLFRSNIWVKNLFASLRCCESLALGLVNRHNTGFYAAIHYSN